MATLDEREALDHRALSDKRSRWIGAGVVIAGAAVSMAVLLWQPLLLFVFSAVRGDGP